MEFSDIISVVAIIIALISLIATIYFNFRDRAKLVLKSVFSPGNADREAYLAIIIVNSGRRPVILRMWGGADENGEWIGEQFGQGGEGKRLGEHERAELVLRKNNFPLDHADTEVMPIEMWIEDTLGRRYDIKDIKKNLKKLITS